MFFINCPSAGQLLSVHLRYISYHIIPAQGFPIPDTPPKSPNCNVSIHLQRHLPHFILSSSSPWRSILKLSVLTGFPRMESSPPLVVISPALRSFFITSSSGNKGPQKSINGICFVVRPNQKLNLLRKKFFIPRVAIAAENLSVSSGFN